MKTFELKSGIFATVDDIDADLAALRWSLCRSGTGRLSARRMVDGKEVRLSRVVAARMGLSIRGRVVLSKNCDPLDYRRENITVGTCAERVSHPVRSGHIKGLFMDGKRYRVRMRVNGELRHIGSFKSAEDAAKAYNRVALEAHGPAARVNFRALRLG